MFMISYPCNVLHAVRSENMRDGKGFEQEAFGGFRVSGRTEKEIERVALRINRSIQIDPHFFDFDIGFVEVVLQKFWENTLGVKSHLFCPA